MIRGCISKDIAKKNKKKCNIEHEKKHSKRAWKEALHKSTNKSIPVTFGQKKSVM